MVTTLLHSTILTPSHAVLIVDWNYLQSNCRTKTPSVWMGHSNFSSYPGTPASLK
jgi:hypothetical protein